MPYFITDRHPDCDGWALVKEDGEFVFCHPNQPAAQDHMIAISLSEDLEPGGEYEGATFRDLRAALPGDKFTTEQEALDRAEEIGCEGTHEMDEDGQTIYMPCSTHAIYEELTGTGEGYSRSEHDQGASTPAEPEEQIEGSTENEPGSASGAGGNIEVSERTEAALRNKVRDHNEAMEEDDRPDWTRTTLGQLKAVYRRGAGAFSTSHRPGMSRAQWAMARVNAYLYLLRNGEPESANYITDYDLLPEDHPKSTRSIDNLEQRDVDLTPPAYMRAAARRGVELYEQGLAGDGVTDQTIREARAMSRGNVSASKWSRIAPWIARHITDLDAESNQPGGEGFPGPGAVAFYLWGAVPTKRGAERVQNYAEGIVDRIEREAEGRARGEMAKKFETRTVETDFEIRQEGDSMTFSGYAALFDSPSHPLPFTERIKPGAFTRSLKSRNNVFMFYNHDSSEILASTRAGTLRLEEDARGLRVEADLAPTTRGNDVSTLIKRGDLYGMSFGFSVPTGGDEWNSEGTERTLKSVRLGEVSIVASPAYPQTEGTVAVRGLDRLALRADVDADALADALVKLETGKTISDSDKEILNTVISTLSPEAEEKEPEEMTDKDMLELKKKKLALMMKEMA
jgi:HK97 family phage prohead protease